MKARYEGVCSDCGKSIELGAEIHQNTAGRWVHEACLASEQYIMPSDQELAQEAMSYYLMTRDYGAVARHLTAAHQIHIGTTKARELVYLAFEVSA